MKRNLLIVVLPVLAVAAVGLAVEACRRSRFVRVARAAAGESDYERKHPRSHA